MSNRTLHNVLIDGADACAEVVKLRMLSSGNRLLVYVRDDGDLITDRVTNSHRKVPLPDKWLVGLFTSKARCADIAEAIGMRSMEIPQ